MNLPISRLLTVAFFAVAMPCIAQTGTVTFYSIGLSAKQEVKADVIPVGTVSFTGWLFDGDQRLAHFQAGRVVSFRLAAGEHQFTAPYHSSHPGKTALHLAVESDGHYCVRLYAKYLSASVLAPVAYVDSQIDQVSCQQAVKEAESYKPIDLKRVDPAVRTKVERSEGISTGN
jgi:hypothetical protein